MNLLRALATFLCATSFVSDSVSAGNTTGNSLDWLLRLYNPHTLGNFSARETNVSDDCSLDVNNYLDALHQEQLWAAKMMDASGRFTSQFFYGNNFWLGSMSLCQELSESHKTSNVPSFPVRFSVARLLIKMKNLSPNQGQLVFLGLCFPVSCSSDDVKYILTNGYNTTMNSGRASLTVLRVRPVPGGYELFKDKKFFALGGSILAVAFLMIVGTLFECVSNRRKTRRVSVKSNGIEPKPEIVIRDVEINKKNPTFECKNKINVYEVNKKDENDNKDSIDNREAGLEGAKEEGEKQRKGFLSEFFLSFSIFSNSGKILNCSRGSEGCLNSVHGLRFLSLAWVILVHTYLQIFAIGENKALRAYTEKMFLYQTVGNATYSVDSFFLISGLLVSYLYFKNVSEEKSKNSDGFGTIVGKFATLVSYRFIRLTPVYLVVLGLVHLTMKVLKDTSVFETPLIVELNCETFWWRNMLYINNFFPKKEMCMLWSWYMAADTQFFVLSSILLLLAKRYFKFSAATTIAILISSWCTTGFISYTNQYRARVEEPLALFDELYDKPWTRIGPYIVGMAAGWYLQRNNCNVRIPIIVVVLGWVSSLGCLMSLVYGTQAGLNVAVSAVYAALGHTAWGLSLAWIIIACSTGYGGWIDSILSCPAFYPLSRLTYCAYLVHPVVMFLTNYVMDGPFHMHNGVVIIIFFGNLVASFMLSFFLSIAFEAPFVRLLKLVLAPTRKR